MADDPAIQAHYAVDDIIPGAVAFPESETEAAAILADAAKQRAAVVPWGSGTGQDFGNPLQRADLVLSLAKLDQVIEYVPADMTITVQAGMRLADLQALTGRNGQMAPVELAHGGQATVGGLVATGAAGPRRMAYGAVRDFLLGARVALPDGRVVKTGGKVVKNVAGYDVTKLLAGSLGTLGVITAVSMKLRPLPADSRTLLFGFADVAGALAAARKILDSELLPVAVVLLTPGPAMRLATPGPVTLVIALEESKSNNDYQVGRLNAMLGTGTALEGQAEGDFWDGVRNYPGECRIKVNTVISQLETYLAGDLGGIAYVGSGTVMLYGPASDAAAIAGRLAAAAAAGGSAVLESGPVALRRRLDVWGPPRPEWKLMQAIKQTFDPGRILNPGRFVGGI